MTIKEAIRILDNETSRDTLWQYDGEENRKAVCFEACQVAADELCRLIAFKKCFDELYGTGLEIANWHMNGNLEPFDNFYEEACNEYARAAVDKR